MPRELRSNTSSPHLLVYASSRENRCLDVTTFHPQDAPHAWYVYVGKGTCQMLRLAEAGNSLVFGDRLRNSHPTMSKKDAGRDPIGLSC